MSIIDKLIAAKDTVAQNPEKELEVSRLSELIGEPFLLRIRALTIDELDTVSKSENMRVATVLKAVISPSLKDEALRKAYTPQGRKNPLTPKELAETLFLPGEIANIHSEILTLSGFSSDSVREIGTSADLEAAVVGEVIKN